MDANQDILKRNKSGEERKLNKLAAENVEEFVNFGTHLFSWLMENVVDDADPAINLLFRDYLDVMDSISILLKSGSADTANILLRSALEIAMSILYILEENTVQRGLSYQLAYFKHLQKQYKKLDKGSAPSVSFTDILKKDIIGRNIIDQIDMVDRKPIIESIENFFSKEPFLKINEEWEHLLQQKKKHAVKIEWYNLFNGPRNFKELCEKLKHHALYEILYTHWSLAAHGKGAMSALLSKGAIKKLRSPLNIKRTLVWTMNLNMEVYTQLVRDRTPDKIEIFGKWYESKVRLNYLYITKKDSKLI